jgi:uncharacterized membrane protein
VAYLIRLELSSDDISVEPGNTVQLSITATNLQETLDNVALEIEGLDVEWYAIPVPSLALPPGASETAKILFRVARASSSTAGAYPFVVRAKGMESGATAVQQATLTVKGFSALQLEIAPKRSHITYLRPHDVRAVTISNQGNQPETLDVFASDNEDACTYEFTAERITLQPGHSETLELTISPKVRRFVGSPRLLAFTVTVRSPRNSWVNDSATGQLEVRPMLTAVTASVVPLLVLAIAAFAVFRPRPVAIQSFTASPMEVTAGAPVTLSWDIAHNGPNSMILPGNLPVKDGVGNMTVVPTETTTYTLVARGGGAEEKRTVTVVVIPKPPPARAVIDSFTASQKRIHMGDTVTLSWKVRNAKLVRLNPVDTQLVDARVYTSRQVTPEQTTTYELAAQGEGGDVVTKAVTVTVVDSLTCIAEILFFRAKPERIQVGEKAVLTWSVEGATSVDIDNGIGGQLASVGKFEVTPVETTTYTLTATDNRGLRKTASVTVTVTAPPTLENIEPATTVPPPR